MSFNIEQEQDLLDNSYISKHELRSKLEAENNEQKEMATFFE
jgi:hypothetical protein